MADEDPLWWRIYNAQTRGDLVCYSDVSKGNIRLQLNTSNNNYVRMFTLTRWSVARTNHFYTPVWKTGRTYYGNTCGGRHPQGFRSLTLKLCKASTWNFIGRYILLRRSEVYKNHNSKLNTFGVIVLCSFWCLKFVRTITQKVIKLLTWTFIGR